MLVSPVVHKGHCNYDSSIPLYFSFLSLLTFSLHPVNIKIRTFSGMWEEKGSWMRDGDAFWLNNKRLVPKHQSKIFSIFKPLLQWKWIGSSAATLTTCLHSKFPWDHALPFWRNPKFSEHSLASTLILSLVVPHKRCRVLERQVGLKLFLLCFKTNSGKVWTNLLTMHILGEKDKTVRMGLTA